MVNNVPIVKNHREEREPLKPGSTFPSSPPLLSGYQTVPRSPKKKDTTLTCRYELKYRIRESKARAIAEYISSYIPFDHYARNTPNHEYPISGVYFDSNQLQLYKETIEKKANRFKLRVRWYDNAPESPCFAEIKRRLNTVIIKDRSRLPKEMLDRVIRHSYVPDSLVENDQKNLRQFQFYLRALCAHPVVLIRYMRQAFEGDSDNRVRVTFDRQLSFKPARRLPVPMDGKGWYPIPMDFVILEVKFTNRYPLWLSDMIKIFDLKQTAMSKYISSVNQSCSMGFCVPLCETGDG